jgi:hypothetical protein
MTADTGVNPQHAPTEWTIDNLVDDWLRRPDTAARMGSSEAAVADPRSALSEFAAAIGTALGWIGNQPPSPGYEPMLVERGIHPILARAMALLLVRRGTRVARESQRLPAVVEAIRFLAKSGRQRAAVIRRAKTLLAAWDETSIIETIFQKARLNDFEFVGVLKRVIEGDEPAFSRAAELAAAAESYSPNLRGRRISAAFAAHEFLLEGGICPGKHRAYSWNDLEGKFTDPLTSATRLEFAAPQFDPRPARRKLRARGNAAPT